MSHEHILVHVDEVDNVLLRAGPPVKVNFSPRLGNISEDLEGREERKEKWEEVRRQEVKKGRGGQRVRDYALHTEHNTYHL